MELKAVRARVYSYKTFENRLSQRVCSVSVDVEFPEGRQGRVVLGPLALVQSERVARLVLNLGDHFRSEQVRLHFCWK